MRIPFIFLLLVPLITGIALTGCSNDDDNTITPKAIDIQVGVLSPMTGDFPSGGEMMNPALELAAEDANQQFEANHQRYEVSLNIGDTHTTGEGALALFESDVADGIDLFVGPMTSAELLPISTSALLANALVVSPSSTSPELAIAGDHIFRLVSGDSSLAMATVEAMWHQGVRAVVCIYRADSWGRALSGFVETSFEAKGGQVLAKLEYAGLRQSLVVEALDSLQAIVESINMPADQIAVQLSTFDEGIMFLSTASDYVSLDQIHWFGSDGYVQNVDLLSDTTASRFAARVELTSGIFAVTETEQTSSFSTRYIERTGQEPGAYAMTAYDALLLAVQSRAAAGVDATMDVVADTLTRRASAKTGLTGSLALDANGDRVDGRYSFWTVVESEGEASWVHTMTYANGVITEE